MRRSQARTRHFVPTLMAAAIVAACGGGGGGGSSDTGLPSFPAAPLPAALPASSPVTMTCADGAAFQCSGGTILRREPSGLGLTASGVQAYAISTSDLTTPNPDRTTATGFRPASGGLTDVAELRLGKAGSGNVDRAALLLSGLGISWDAVVERPPIIEAFEPTQGITRLDNAGALSLANALPVFADPYWDYNDATLTGTQTHYANNRYFPRDTATQPTRGCPNTPTACNTETTGPTTLLGNFRTGGSEPDRTNAHRGHSDGDVHAGLNGPGVPYAGNKGYRDLLSFGFAHANITAWVNEETAEIDEWTAASELTEHTTNRRGFVAFGATTDPAAVPASGTATYTGVTYGWFSPNGEAVGANAVLQFFRADVRLDVDFGSRQVAVRVTGAKVDGTTTDVPVSIGVNAGFGTAGSNVTNYMVGPVDGGANAFAGGVGGRFFGPAAQEIAGTFTLRNATSNAATVGGFIARRQ